MAIIVKKNRLKPQAEAKEFVKSAPVQGNVTTKMGLFKQEQAGREMAVHA